MQEMPKILLEETFKLLDELIPIVERNIDALKHNSNTLVQHLIQQEIESYQKLLERTEETKNRFQDLLDSQKVEQEEAELKEVELEEVQAENDDSEEILSEKPEREETHLQETEPQAVEPEEDELRRPKLGINQTAAGHPIAPITVKMPDGTLIRRRYGSNTFVEVIKKIGIKQVRDLRIECRNVPLIGTTDYSKIRQAESGIYYIVTGITTDEKIEILLEIARRLGIDMDPRFDESPWY